MTTVMMLVFFAVGMIFENFLSELHYARLKVRERAILRQLLKDAYVDEEYFMTKLDERLGRDSG